MDRSIASMEYVRRLVVAALTFLVLSLISLIVITDKANALTTVPTQVNFQGRLTDPSGNVKPDGSYNMTFRLFTASSGGSAVWTEVRETTNRVTLTNGLFSVQLGSVTPLSASLFASGNLYLEIELPSTATATCSTSSCASYTEGPMTPRNVLATSAYAYNAETLDGIDSSAFGQLSANNTFTGTNLFKLTSASAVDIQNAGGTSLLLADTNGTVVKIGNPGSGTLSNVRLLTTNAEVTSTLRIGNLTDGVEFASGSIPLYRGAARPTRTVTLAPEFAGATFRGDGGSNNGSLSSDFCSYSLQINYGTTSFACPNSGEEHNYYEWTTTQASAQNYDIYVVYQMPSDYDTGSMTNMVYYAEGETTSEAATLYMYKGSTTQCSDTGDVVTSANTWQSQTVASPLGLCTINAGDKVVFKVHVSATQNKKVRAGEINFTYRSKF